MINSPNISFNKIRKICCIGAGYVGGPTMSVIADKCPDLEIRVVDINKNRIAAWNDEDLNKLPIFEPGLDQIISRTRGKNLFFSTEMEKSISGADMIFISVNTPTKNKGLGAGQASDLSWVEASARQVAKYATGYTIVVEKSTLPVRTAHAIKEILQTANRENQKNNISKTFSVLSNPEFLAEGTAINDLELPDRVLIGGEDPDAVNALVNIYLNWVPREQIICTNLWSSELSKLAANAFLAQRISSINSISAFCEATGADIQEVAKAIGTDKRIGDKFLSAGPGFGGSCFKKDILNLVYLSGYFGLPEVANYWNQVVVLNTWQQDRIYKIVLEKLFGTVNGKNIAILGFSFKANTNDTRESPAIRIASDLLEEGASLAIYDPKVSFERIQADFENFSPNNQGLWKMVNSIPDALQNVDAVLILTAWDEFYGLDWSHLASLMRSPAWVFDTRSVVSRKEIENTSLNLWKLGEGS
tara:strand:+ start:3682 stop:5103 length:1422 start_codon:yes stop_codon:yes gene_type:complete